VHPHQVLIANGWLSAEATARFDWEKTEHGLARSMELRGLDLPNPGTASIARRLTPN
jgi:hypothetical protein